MKKSKPSDLMRMSIRRKYAMEPCEAPKSDMNLYLKIEAAENGATIQYDGSLVYARFLAAAMGRDDVRFG